jgi:hypothetical protein
MVHVNMTTLNNLNAMNFFMVKIHQSAKMKRVSESPLLNVGNFFLNC